MHWNQNPALGSHQGRGTFNSSMNSNNLCPVCGYDLGFEPWQGDSPSDEICPCCHIQFGYQDSARDPERRKVLHTKWRQQWMAEGMKWCGKGIKPPPGWDPVEQLKRIGVV